MFLRGSLLGKAAALAASLALCAGMAEAAGGYPGGYTPGYFSGYNHNGYSPGTSYYQGRSYPQISGNFPGGYYPGYFANYNSPYQPGPYPSPAVGYTAPVPPVRENQAQIYLHRTPAQAALPTTGADAGGVTITVHVPADAEVWFDGDSTQQGGEWREFASPPLTPGMDYSYEIRARWTVAGQAVEQTRTLVMRANDKVEVSFIPPTTIPRR
jgi:uncharacterized protein (TIGR03000 family)